MCGEEQQTGAVCCDRCPTLINPSKIFLTCDYVIFPTIARSPASLTPFTPQHWRVLLSDWLEAVDEFSTAAARTVVQLQVWKTFLNHFYDNSLFTRTCTLGTLDIHRLKMCALMIRWGFVSGDVYLSFVWKESPVWGTKVEATTLRHLQEFTLCGFSVMWWAGCVFLS